VREPDSPHDAHAAAIQQGSLHVGYINKGMARSLTKALANGLALKAHAISVQPPKVIAASPVILAHILRHR
jgi:hypothetical protein